MGLSRRTPTLKTTERSFEIVETIQDMQGARLTEIADELDLAKSTIHKHLNTLLNEGYLVQNGAEYDIGFKFVNKSEYIKSQETAYSLTNKQIRELAELTDEEVAFEVEDRGKLLTIYEAYTASTANRRAGSYHHMHNTASGKAILAEFSRERVEQIIDLRGLPSATDQTITSRQQLFEELDRTRDRGFAINDEEFLTGLRAVGMSITAPDGRVFGAIDVSGPAYRITDELLTDELPDQLRDTCADIERELDCF